MVGQSNEQAVFPLFYRVGLEIITFPAGIAAIFNTELIAVQRAHHIARCVDVAVGEKSARVWAFMGKSKIHSLVPADADLPALHFHYCDLLIIHAQLGCSFCDLMPLILLLRHLTNRLSYKDSAPGTVPSPY